MLVGAWHAFNSRCRCSGRSSEGVDTRMRGHDDSGAARGMRSTPAVFGWLEVVSAKAVAARLRHGPASSWPDG